MEMLGLMLGACMKSDTRGSRVTRESENEGSHLSIGKRQEACGNANMISMAATCQKHNMTPLANTLSREIAVLVIRVQFVQYSWQRRLLTLYFTDCRRAHTSRVKSNTPVAQSSRGRVLTSFSFVFSSPILVSCVFILSFVVETLEV
jgi:hypothetical protein